MEEYLENMKDEVEVPIPNFEAYFNMYIDSIFNKLSRATEIILKTYFS